MGVCRQGLQTLTLLKTKSVHFATLFKTRDLCSSLLVQKDTLFKTLNSEILYPENHTRKGTGRKGLKSFLFTPCPRSSRLAPAPPAWLLGVGNDCYVQTVRVSLPTSSLYGCRSSLKKASNNKSYDKGCI